MEAVEDKKHSILGNETLNRNYNEDCLTTMARMPNELIDMVCTSPPYDTIRDYKGFTFDFETIAKELYRVIKPGGVVVWVVGDETSEGSESGTSFRQALFFQEIGFNIHDTMIYEKNGAAYPANDSSVRYSQVFEYMFVFSKGKPKTINLLKDKHNRWFKERLFGVSSTRRQDGILKPKEDTKVGIEEYGYRNNIWRYNNGFGYSTKDEIAFEHPAIFPELLASDMIKSWSNGKSDDYDGDIVYDPFSGSGTTLKAAHILGRRWCGSEISAEYCEIARKRMEPYMNLMF